MAINSYLQQLDHPQVAFGVKQKRPKSMDEAVSATLEMESYLTQPRQIGGVTPIATKDSEASAMVAATTVTDRLTTLVEKLYERVEKLELKQGAGSRSNWKTYGARGRSRGGTRRTYAGGSTDVICWSCGLTSHIARNCKPGPGN